MTKYHTAVEDADTGWTEWYAAPALRKLACCDCGLVHNVEVAAAANGAPAVRFQRNVRATAAMRRERRK